ncbi:hypothetical protein MTO96_049900 [Rhipicephalus appendiculatus]
MRDWGPHLYQAAKSLKHRVHLGRLNRTSKEPDRHVGFPPRTRRKPTVEPQVWSDAPRLVAGSRSRSYSKSKGALSSNPVRVIDAHADASLTTVSGEKRRRQPTTMVRRLGPQPCQR